VGSNLDATLLLKNLTSSSKAATPKAPDTPFAKASASARVVAKELYRSEELYPGSGPQARVVIQPPTINKQADN